MIATRRREVFHWGPYAWDVSAAKNIVADRVPIGRVKPAEWGGFGALVAIDREHAKTVDLTVPLIAVPVPGTHGSPLILDGWHRLLRSYLDGVDELLTHVLTAAEEAQIRIHGPGNWPYGR
ncbi:hypothetical protein ACIBKY_51345 [Nonomuraea sp. NPDC050394]|uniref:hypothetical protein n=1 Tax=Nonomuraea sp. NPDC050394 TaxID=3364363 RepID=UPI0037A7415E